MSSEPSSPAPAASRKPRNRDINWDDLDQRKFFFVGAGLFTGVTTALFPLTLMKTRQQALSRQDGGSIPLGAIARDVWRTEGVRGFYRGFGTVILGSFPARLLFVPTLEYSKTRATQLSQQLGFSPETSAALGSGMAGGISSLVSQGIFVPVDVISQRLMVQGGGLGTKAEGPGGGPKYRNGLQALRLILATEGVRGLYRGFFASVSLFVPQSTLWWGSYGLYQKLLFGLEQWVLDRSNDTPTAAAASTAPQTARGTAATAALQPATAAPSSTAVTSVSPQLQRSASGSAAAAKGAPHLGDLNLDDRALSSISAGPPPSSPSEPEPPSPPDSLAWTVAVQTSSALLAGMTTGALTTPLDTIKTRLQVAEADPITKATPTFRQVATDLWRREGPRGFLRGMPTRMASSMIWGTVMVSSLEALKRLCVKDPATSEGGEVLVA